MSDPDLWLKDHNQDGIDYYSYILCYVDDIIVIHHDARPILDRIDKLLKLKESSVGKPDIYLGAKLNDLEVKCRDV